MEKVATSERPCPTCKRKGFKHLSSYVRHVRLCGKKVEHKCGKCSRLFSCKDALRRHLCIQKVTSHDCNVCAKSFQHGWMLARHIKAVHKDLSCTICGAKFNSKMLLKLHSKEHKQALTSRNQLVLLVYLRHY